MTMKAVYFLFVLCSPILTDNSFLQWAHYADLQNQTACLICRILPVSRTSGLPWWASPLQGTNCTLYTYISEIIYNYILFCAKSITNQHVSPWPYEQYDMDLPGHNQTFSHAQTIKILIDFINP